MAGVSAKIVPGRSCEGCTMCCRLFPVPALNKGAGRWCHHCAIGQGCKIYEKRPALCREFYCEYLINAELGEHWKPSRARMVVTKSVHERVMHIHVDGDRPAAWTAKRYLSDIRRWADQAADENVRVVIVCGEELREIIPRRAQDGKRGADEFADLMQAGK